MKAILAGIYSFLMVFGAVVTFAAEEAKKEGGGGYDSTAYVWIALIVLAPVAILGLVMFARWLPTYRSSHATISAGGGSDASGETPPERSFPVAIVGGHGVLAVVTVILVLLTMLGVGGS